jgi:hypothetical protein
LSTDVRPWSVLLLSAGYGNETQRDLVNKAIGEFGFKVAVYDRPGYPVGSQSHSHEVCIEAIDQADIVVALVDEKEGGELQVDSLSPGLISKLEDLGVLQREYSYHPTPSILQAEILVAKAKHKPVICLVPNEVRERCDAVLGELPGFIEKMTPRHAKVPDALSLIQDRLWTELHGSYNVPTNSIAFGQLAFLERIRREAPNYVSYFHAGSNQDLADHLKSRLASLPPEIAQLNYGRVKSMLDRKRTPVAGTESLTSLHERGLIVPGPYKPDAGSGVDELPLIGDKLSGALASYVRSGASVALVGAPGMGKSTYLLFTAMELLHDTRDAQSCVLFASSSDLLRRTEGDSAEHLIRTLIGMAGSRAIWPESLPLPSVNWNIVIDGVDESEVPFALLPPLLGDLREFGTLLVSCREFEFDREFHRLQDSFEKIIRLLPWGKDEIDQYRNKLSVHGKGAAVEYLDSHRSDHDGLLAIPLWLTMITSLVEREDNATASDKIGDYALLSHCSSAFGLDELGRQGRESSLDEPLLVRAWEGTAWHIHKMRRHGSNLRVQSLQKAMGIHGRQMWNSCRSILDERGGTVFGFANEVLFEYWLARYIVSAMVTPGIAPDLLAEALSFQRSTATNRLVRQGIELSDNVSKAAAALREAFWHVDSSRIEGRQAFAKNQILYSLGRIDSSEATVSFLCSIWANKAESTFARHAAAHAGAGLGASSVEREYYEELTSDDSFDRKNRLFHRYYYGDLPVDESNGFEFEDAGPAAQAVEQLLLRLGKTPQRYFNLRRIDLFTLRRFLDTRGLTVVDSLHLKRVLDAIEDELRLLQNHDSYADSVNEELARIRASLV